MTVRRKSNWYIYLITFVVTGVLLGALVWSIWDYLIPPKEVMNDSSGITDFRPDESHNMNILVMLAENLADEPQYYMAINYRPRDESIVCVPLTKTLKAGDNTLQTAFTKDGVKGVKNAIEKEFGIKMDKYIKFDKRTLVDFFDIVGGVSVNVPREIPELDVVAGVSTLDGDHLYNYMTYNSFTEGADYQLTVQSSVLISLINVNFRMLTSNSVQSYFNKIMNTTDTDIQFEDYTLHQKALLFTTENSIDPAEYCIPYGTVVDNMFVIDENSKATILDRMGMIAY